MRDLSITDRKEHDASVHTLSGEIAAPMRDVWHVVSDTDRINQVVYNFPPVEMLDEDAWKIVGRIHLEGNGHRL